MEKTGLTGRPLKLIYRTMGVRVRDVVVLWRHEYLWKACMQNRTRGRYTPFFLMKKGIKRQRFPPLVAFPGSESGTVFFMIVSLPEDAADTICCSMDLVTFALSALRMPASLTSAVFLGGSCLRPFFGAAAALAACLAFEDEGLVRRPLVLP